MQKHFQGQLKTIFACGLILFLSTFRNVEAAKLAAVKVVDKDYLQVYVQQQGPRSNAKPWANTCHIDIKKLSNGNFSLNVSGIDVGTSTVFKLFDCSGRLMSTIINANNRAAEKRCWN